MRSQAEDAYWSGSATGSPTYSASARTRLGRGAVGLARTRGVRRATTGGSTGVGGSGFGTLGIDGSVTAGSGPVGSGPVGSGDTAGAAPSGTATRCDDRRPPHALTSSRTTARPTTRPTAGATPGTAPPSAAARPALRRRKRGARISGWLAASVSTPSEDPMVSLA